MGEISPQISSFFCLFKSLAETFRVYQLLLISLPPSCSRIFSARLIYLSIISLIFFHLWCTGIQNPCELKFVLFLLPLFLMDEFLFVHIPFDWKCPWCNGYRRRNWTRRHEFKSWTDCISHSTNTLGKGMNPVILPPAMGK